ncbi:uncharacterized protein SAPINGB_P001313 [Magnusiomyces paraingens]|uniref:Histone deacetylase domain-containing protein n=1 Tax=Magnusiomyces paraingens TaxID=2606893 RepID=A0A5E8B793_9ASCO|nr:uncharacterized protein SAPINGB_P001313 [Saprochaete ingens]VVT46638.1 unnamed protein product [Saprochaete ingens]
MNGLYLEEYPESPVSSDSGSAPQGAWGWPNTIIDSPGLVGAPISSATLSGGPSSWDAQLSADDLALIQDSLQSQGMFLGTPLQKFCEPMAPLNSRLCALTLEEQAKQQQQQQQQYLRYFYPNRGVTAIVLAPKTFAHTFARPWVSAAARRGVVERPQRLVACGIGIGAALSLHYSSQSGIGSIPPEPSLSSLASSPDVVVKTCVRQVDLRKCTHVAKVHGPQWAHDMYALCETASAKLASGTLEVPAAWPCGDMYLCAGTASALENVVGALENGVDLLFSDSEKNSDGNHDDDDDDADVDGDNDENKDQVDRAFIVVRPPGHHARRGTPSGFCVMNNVHVGIQYAEQTYGITHVAVIDFDLHHGDGTQALCFELAKKENEEGRVIMGYFSVHDIESFPAEDQGLEAVAAASLKQVDTIDCDGRATGSGPCVWNVHLDPWGSQGGAAGESTFWEAYETKYKQIVDQAEEFLRREYMKYWRGNSSGTGEKQQNIEFQPLVVVSAGFDASEHEAAGMRRHGACVPTQFFERVTTDIVSMATKLGHEFGIGPQIKILSVLEGGYADKALATGVFAHLTGLLGSRKEFPSGETQDQKYDIGNPFVANELERACRGRWNVGSVRGALSGRRKVSGPAAAWVARASGEERERVARWLERGLVAGRDIWGDDSVYREWRLYQGRSDGGREVPIANDRVLRSNHHRREKQQQQVVLS